MADKKPGLLKRIFSFGFGKKNAEEPEVEEIVEAPALEAPVVEEVAEPVVEEIPAPASKPATKKAPAKTKEKPAPKAKKETTAKPEKKTKANAGEQKAKTAKAEKIVEKKTPSPKKAAPKKETSKKTTPKPAPEPIEEIQEVEIEEVVATTEPTLETIVEEVEIEEVLQDDMADELLDEVVEEHFDDIEEEAEIEAPIEPTPPVEPSQTAVTLTERKEPKQPEPEIKPEVEEKKTGWLKRLSKGLSRSSNALTENITKVFTEKKLDDDTLQELEDILLQADLGIETAMKITDALSSQKFGKTVTDQEVREIMAEEIEKILSPVAKDLDLDLQHQPHVILMIGVNGSGKTTTIGKLSQKLYDAGFSTSLVAGDTFRAAAVEQLKIWGERTQSPVLFRDLGADAAGLAYDAWDNTHEDRRDVMLMDTAGRLQNRTELMDELEKIVRVLKKQDPSAPHTVLLTLDATTGQNALNQVEIFKEVAGVNGIVMTKLDGTARGGILVAIAAKYKLPVYFVGVGEGVEDLEPFEARDFARSIAGLPAEE